MTNFEGFPCRICKKKVKERFCYTREYNEKYGNQPCPNCGKILKWVVELADNYLPLYNGSYKKKYVGCLECNPVMSDTEMIWYTDRVCGDCFFGRKGKKIQNDTKKNNSLTNLAQENQELCQKLAEVQKQLAEVLAELKKLRNNLNGKDGEKLKLEYQIFKNEKLIKNQENTSLSEIQEQVNKSQTLIKEVQNTSAIFPTKSTEERKRNNSHLTPYLLGGLVVISICGLMFVGGLLVGKKSKKVKN